MQPDNANVSAAAEPSHANGHSTLHDIFVLSDEQILEIDPEPQDVEISSSAPSSSQQNVAPACSPAVLPAASANSKSQQSSTEHRSRNTGHENRSAQAESHAEPNQSAQPRVPVPAEPPAWLAAQMKDAWTGEEARALWQRMQTTENEAAAYREVFAKPEDARAIKALYPGGFAEAQATAQRAQMLDEIDRAYFAPQASTPEQARASRAQLAAMMLREDPAAFREMVHEGLRALEAAEKQPPALANAANLPRIAQVLRSDAPGANVAPPFRAAVADPQATPPLTGTSSPNDPQLAAYSAFERAANAELEKTVGNAIDRALHQALPNISAVDPSSNVGARFSASPAPLQARLSQAIREDVERALQADRQLGDQVAQVLSGRRLDDATRAQVVRLINDRALQLVPAAAKRALNEWTQATLAAHRSRTTRSDSGASRREVATSATATAPRDLRTTEPVAHAFRGEAVPSRQANRTARAATTRPTPNARVNYTKLSDEQILDL